MGTSRAVALLIAPLVLGAASVRLVAQMVPAGTGTDSRAVNLPLNSAQPLYTSSDDTAPIEPATSLTSTPPSVLLGPHNLSLNPAPSASAPIVASPAAFTLPPRPPHQRRVHDLPSLAPKDRVRPFRSVALGLTAGTLGAGAELAIPIAPKFNLRAGVGYFNWKGSFNSDGIVFVPAVKLTSTQATIDWFPSKKGFHLSIGALLLRTRAAGLAAVSGGTSFTLDSSSYLSSVDDPINGVARLTFGDRVAPLVLLGFGNLLPRTGKHVTFPFEVGAAAMRPPQLTVQLQGTACTSQGCFNTVTDPDIQKNLKAEVVKLQNDLQLIKAYPMVSLGVACRF